MTAKIDPYELPDSDETESYTVDTSGYVEGYVEGYRKAQKDILAFFEKRGEYDAKG